MIRDHWFQRDLFQRKFLFNLFFIIAQDIILKIG